MRAEVKRTLCLLPFLVACGGVAESGHSDETGALQTDRIQCPGELPDVSECELTDPDSPWSQGRCGQQWYCPEWHDNPYDDEGDEAYQLIAYCDGLLTRGAVSRITTQVMCLDKIYSREWP